MSVNFHATNMPELGFEFRCYNCDHMASIKYYMATCPHCEADHYDVMCETAYLMPIVNMANGNAALIQRFLGLPSTEYGNLSGTALEGAVVAMQAMLDADADSLLHFERQPEGSVGRYGAWVLVAGADREYLLRRGREVYNLAKWAAENGESLTWD